MEPLSYSRAFRRRWYVIPLCVAVAVGAAWITTETVAPAAPPESTYLATAEMLATGGGPTFNLVTMATIAGTRPVAELAAEELGGSQPADSVRARVGITPDTDAGFLYITSTSADRMESQETAAAYAEALEVYLRGLAAKPLSKEIRQLDEQIDQARREGDAVKVDELTFARDARAEELATVSSGLIMIGKPVAEVRPVVGFQPPQSRVVRLGIAAAIGLLAGIALILLLERFDTRIRSRESAEERFVLPVMTEIPNMDRRIRRGVAIADAPTSAAADAFRLLGAGVGVAAERRFDDKGVPRRGRVVLVTSPGPSEGKTTTVANLAAALSEEGSRILLISADLRRPQLHDRVGAIDRPGLVELVEAEGRERIDVAHPTRVRKVLIVPSGKVTSRPGEVLGSPEVKRLIDVARDQADWILIDTSPLLTASESALLLGEADLVLVVVMAGRASAALALRTKETLEQLEVAETRIVLNGARELAMPSGYRSYYRKAPPEYASQSGKKG